MVKYSEVKFFLIIFVVVFLFPGRPTVLAATVEELQQQLARLQEQVVVAQMHLARAKGLASLPQDFRFEKDRQAGDYDVDVVSLQTFLQAKGFFCRSCVVTGFFGSGTAQSLRLFQRKYGLALTGQLDPATRNKLNGQIGQPPALAAKPGAKVLGCAIKAPASPQILAPKDNEVVSLSDLSLQWSPTNDWGVSCPDSGQASSDKKYHLRLDEQADFSSPLIDAFFPLEQTSFSLPTEKLQSGSIYHWQLTAVAHGLESAPREQSFGLAFSPDVDLRANNAQGPLLVNYNNSVTLSWQAGRAKVCEAAGGAEGGWSGAKDVKGSESSGPLTSSRVFKISCFGDGGQSSDQVEVDVLPLPTLELSLQGSLDGQAWQDSLQGLTPLPPVSVKMEAGGNVSGPVSYSISCEDNGVWDYASKKSDEASKTLSGVCHYSSLGGHHLKARVERSGLKAEKSLTVVVLETATPDLKVTKIDVSNSRPSAGQKIGFVAHVTNVGPGFEQGTVFYWSVNRVPQVRGFLAGFGPGEEKTLSFGTTFSGEPLSVTFQADAEHQLAEASEANNSLEVRVGP